MLRRTFTCFFLIMAVGCAPGQQDADDASAAEVAIEVATESWIAAYEQGDVEMLVNLFEEDALYVANTGEVLRDRNGIRNGVRKWLAHAPRASVSISTFNPYDSVFPAIARTPYRVS